MDTNVTSGATALRIRFVTPKMPATAAMTSWAYAALYSSGRYGINKDDLLPLCNTLRYVMYKGDGKFATSVDGQGKTSESLGGTYVYLSQVMPDLYPILAPAMTSRAKTRPETDGRLLWTKAERLRATRQ